MLRCMVAARSLFPIEPAAAEQRLVLSGVSWATYVMLRDSLDHTNVRMTYLEGVLEIMSPSKRHEIEKKHFARFLELFCAERDIPLYPYGSTTWRSEPKARGLEADECYARSDRELPEIALEVIVSHGSLDKLEVYRGLGIREVWLLEAGACTVLSLRDAGYVEIPASEVFPEVDLVRLVHYAMRPDHHVAVRAYRDELRGR
jgi:Uma2 family endonuclease